MDSSETGDGDSVVEEVLTGFALLAHLNIPAQPLVYCPIAQGLVKVTDRQEAVGLCLNQDSDSGLYMTADELPTLLIEIGNAQIMKICIPYSRLFYLSVQLSTICCSGGNLSNEHGNINGISGILTSFTTNSSSASNLHERML